LDEAYPEPRQPDTFDARYSGAEAFEHLDDRLQNAPPDDQQKINQSTLDRIERHFGVGSGAEFTLRDMEAFTDNPLHFAGASRADRPDRPTEAHDA
jgi:CRISPR-associated endonuclease/helicase Cas3